MLTTLNAMSNSVQSSGTGAGNKLNISGEKKELEYDLEMQIILPYWPTSNAWKYTLYSYPYYLIFSSTAQKILSPKQRLFREIVTIYSDNYLKHRNTLWAK
jgi:hypothetical protein